MSSVLKQLCDKYRNKVFPLVVSDSVLGTLNVSKGGTSADNAKDARTNIGAADVAAFSAHYTNGVVDGLGLGTPAPSKIFRKRG